MDRVLYYQDYHNVFIYVLFFHNVLVYSLIFAMRVYVKYVCENVTHECM